MAGTYQVTEMRLTPGQKLSYRQHAEYLLRKHGYSRTRAGEIVRGLGLRMDQPKNFGELLADLRMISEAAAAFGHETAPAAIRREAERLSSISWLDNPMVPWLAMKHAEERDAFRRALAILQERRSPAAAYRLLERHPELIAHPESAPAPRKKRVA